MVFITICYAIAVLSAVNVLNVLFREMVNMPVPLFAFLVLLGATSIPLVIEPVIASLFGWQQIFSPFSEPLISCGLAILFLALAIVLHYRYKMSHFYW